MKSEVEVTDGARNSQPFALHHFTSPFTSHFTSPLTSHFTTSHFNFLTSLLLTSVLVFGSALRLIWIEDMEYKADEMYMHAVAQQYRASHVLPVVGNASSVALRNASGQITPTR